MVEPGPTLIRLGRFYGLQWNMEWMADQESCPPEVAGAHQLSSTTMLRRRLSQWSLAIEFDDSEKSTYGTSKVKERGFDVSVETSRRLGYTGF